MSVLIEALYIFDDKKNCLLEHVYRARPPRPSDLVSRYTTQPSPLPSIIQLSDLNPPTTVYTVHHGALALQCTTTNDLNSLAAIEFLNRTIDILEDFLGSPLLPHKIEENYEVVAQILGEICDGGVVCNTEANALKESIEVSSKLGKLFETVGLPGNSASLGLSNQTNALKAPSTVSFGPAIPWRRANVRYTSNELYVDIVESLSVIFAPSGQPLSARSNGSIAFTSKISGVPDLLLHLNAPGGTSSFKSSGIARTMQLPTFHPCVRLARWKENPGELSFIPPDGKFMLAGYEVDLLPNSINNGETPSRSERIYLPTLVDMKTGLGPNNTDFEARLTLNNNFPGVSIPKPATMGRSTSTTTPFSFGNSTSGSSSAPSLEAVVVTIPFPRGVRNIADVKPSRGDVTFNIHDKSLEWKIPTKDGFSVNGTAILTGSIVAQVDADYEEDDDNDNEDNDEFSTDDTIEDGKSKSLAGYYDEETTNGYSEPARKKATLVTTKQNRKEINRKLMPRSIAVSFAVKGWLPSGIKVESLTVDTKKSKGLGEGVRPYKGVKYLTISKRGVERRL